MKLKYFGHCHDYSLDYLKNAYQVKLFNKRKKGKQRMRCFNNVIEAMVKNLGKLQEPVKDRGARHTVVHKTH